MCIDSLCTNKCARILGTLIDVEMIVMSLLIAGPTQAGIHAMGYAVLST